MKRFFLYAMMTAGVLASCSQNENDGLPNNEPADLTPSADAILLSAAAPSVTVNASTRSAGTIGGDGANITNSWSGQKLYIYACQKDSKTGITMSDKISDPNTYALYNEEGMVGTGDKISGVTWTDNESRYFPRSGAFDFFGYYGDDAVTGEPQSEAMNGTNVLYKSFIINGSQDLMIAKAELSEGDKTTLGEADINKAYSSYTARRGVQPSMKFEHLLTRLVFNIKGLGESQPENVYVQSIKVMSKTTGKLVFVYADDTNKGIQWDVNDKGSLLSLQERNANVMQELTDKKYYASATGAPAPTPVGEALLVESGVGSYYIEVAVKQERDKDGNTIPVEQQTETYKLTLQASDVTKGEASAGITTFAPSTSYNVTIAVYSVEKIELKAELGEWIEGGDIVINPDDTFTE
ncbi:fimbrillin family protein [Bacteroides difficilis]|uniref:Fimbrillin family protein n=1 Tax=Bacteroides difficilis TaxID=2763021 RepID=A0ABR7C7C5_9BACE|nr:fimbrillin family protein [Bacteroides difficilis]MBC5603710.1 fimbrillin family protein [Bacteroides difficilis]